MPIYCNRNVQILVCFSLLMFQFCACVATGCHNIRLFDIFLLFWLLLQGFLARHPIEFSFCGTLGCLGNRYPLLIFIGLLHSSMFQLCHTTRKFWAASFDHLYRLLGCYGWVTGFTLLLQVFCSNCQVAWVSRFSSSLHSLNFHISLLRYWSSRLLFWDSVTAISGHRFCVRAAILHHQVAYASIV